MTKKERMLAVIEPSKIWRASPEEQKALNEIRGLIRDAMPDVEDGGQIIIGRVFFSSLELNLAQIPSLCIDIRLNALKERILAAWREDVVQVEKIHGKVS